MKKFLSLILSAVMLMTVFSALTLASSAAVDPTWDVRYSVFNAGGEDDLVILFPDVKEAETVLDFLPHIRCYTFDAVYYPEHVSGYDDNSLEIEMNEYLPAGSYALVFDSETLLLDGELIEYDFVAYFTVFYDSDSKMRISSEMYDPLCVETSVGYVGFFRYYNHLFFNFNSIAEIYAASSSSNTLKSPSSSSSCSIDMGYGISSANVVYIKNFFTFCEEGDYEFTLEPGAIVYTELSGTALHNEKHIHVPFTVYEDGDDFKVRLSAPKKYFDRGSGTFDDPYIIACDDDFKTFDKMVEEGRVDWDMHFALDADVNCSKPVGFTNLIPFDGVFDGRGHTVHLNIPKCDSGGMFYMISDEGFVKNLITDGSVFSPGNAGSVAAECCGVVLNCMNYASVSGNRFIGGIVGRVCGNATVQNCANYGSVANVIENEMGYLCSGGIVGLVDTSSGRVLIANCLSVGDVTVEKFYYPVGAFIGYNQGSETSVIYSVCDIDSWGCTKYVGSGEFSVDLKNTDNVLGSPDEWIKKLDEVINVLNTFDSHSSAYRDLIKWTRKSGEYPVIDYSLSAIPMQTVVRSLGAKINETTNSLRLGASYDASSLDKEARVTVTDIGIVFYPSHLLGEDSLDLENENAVSISACGIEEGYDPAKKFTDYDSFTFYVTIVNIPEYGRDTNISFRPFIVFGGETVCYDGTMQRSYNYVLNTK